MCSFEYKHLNLSITEMTRVLIYWIMYNSKCAGKQHKTAKESATKFDFLIYLENYRLK